MTSLAFKRKARKIPVEDEDTQEAHDGSPLPSPMIKFSKKTAKSSTLRKSINIGENAAEGNQNDDGPAVVRPSVSRSGSLWRKNKKAGPRLSFGPSDQGDTADLSFVATPKKSGLSHQALMNRAKNLPMRSFAGESEEPKYSREFLQELQSSTPTTPARHPTTESDTDMLDLDDSELEGAVIVESKELSHPTRKDEATRILTQAEIEEKKSRRHKLATALNEDGEDYISLDDRMSDKKNTRLVPEDEDLGEGFDEFVEDGGVALGKKAERDRRRAQRNAMADLINEAEYESESDSEAEQIAAFEDAQTQAAMEGLKSKDPSVNKYQSMSELVPPKITPIPDISECLARFKATLKVIEEDLHMREIQLESWRKERLDIDERQQELQIKLAESSEKYKVLLPDLGTSTDDKSPLYPLLPAERGLESFGNTPLRQNTVESGELDGDRDADMGGL